MWKTWVKQGLLGALGAAAVLTGCDYGGRVWSLTAQEDYYPEQAQGAVGKSRSNIGSSSSLFETVEQQEGTGGAGEATPGGQASMPPRIQGSAQEQEHLWLQQDERVPFPPPQLSALVAPALGTGRPLRVGPHGAWIQGTYGVELGSGLARSIAPTSASYQPEERTVGEQSLPRNVPSEGQQAREKLRGVRGGTGF